MIQNLWRLKEITTTQHLYSYSPIVPAVSDRVQTVQAVASEVGGGKGVLGDGGGEEGEAGRPGHWTAAMGMDRASVSAVQNTSEGPDGGGGKGKISCRK